MAQIQEPNRKQDGKRHKPDGDDEVHGQTLPQVRLKTNVFRWGRVRGREETLLVSSRAYASSPHTPTPRLVADYYFIEAQSLYLEAEAASRRFATDDGDALGNLAIADQLRDEVVLPRGNIEQ